MYSSIMVCSNSFACLSMLCASILWLVSLSQHHQAAMLWSNNALLLGDDNHNFAATTFHNNDTTFARVWTQLTISVEFDAPIVEHALHYYQHKLGLNPQHFLITLHHTDGNAPELHQMATHLSLHYPHHVQTWSGNFTSDLNCQQRQQQRLQVGVDDCDWVLKFDADEFLRVPGNGSNNAIEFLSHLGQQGFDSLSASWKDRVAEEGVLPNITATPSIDQQFPLSCAFSGAAANATTRKVVAFRGYLKEKRAGHSLAKGLETCRYPVQLVLDHYKWSEPVVEKLRQRLVYYKTLASTYWWTESASFLEHIDANGGKIDVRNPDYQCTRDDTVTIHSFFSIEDGVKEAEPCRRVRQCPNRLQ